tara:strand:- start:399 stop:671 length:273 start_codon:yes stop_codon:yes gene_type:complete
MMFDVKEYLKDQAELAEYEQRYHNLIKKHPEYMDEAVELLAKTYARVLEALKDGGNFRYEEETREIMYQTFGDVYGGLEKLVIRKHNSCS